MPRRATCLAAAGATPKAFLQSVAAAAAAAALFPHAAPSFAAPPSCVRRWCAGVRLGPQCAVRKSAGVDGAPFQPVSAACPRRIYHMGLVAQNTTTNEDIKGAYNGRTNPYDRVRI